MTRSQRLMTAISAALLVALLCLAPARAGSGILTVYGVTNNGGSPATYTLNVNATSGITVGDHVVARLTSGVSGVWLVTAKTATSVTIQDSLTEQNGTAFGPPAANVNNGLGYATPAANGTTMVPDNATWWGAANRRNAYLAATSASGTGAALTRTDDTNVTLTLGGAPSTALLNAASLTLGWTGTLAESRGGTGAASLSAGLDAAFGSTRGSVLYRGASGWVVLAPGTSGYALVSNGAGADPSYQAAITPALGAVLAAGADGNAVDQTNLGSLTLATGEVVTTGAYIVGAATTSGVRLDLESGSLAVREGDDSNYAPMYCGGLVVTSSNLLNGIGTAAVVGWKFLTNANTSDATLAGTNSTRIHTNEGATGAVNLTLPAATVTSGYVIEAVVQANQYLRFTAGTGDTIRDGATVSGAAGYIRSTTVGSTIRLYCINATEWIVLSKTGTWTVDS